MTTIFTRKSARIHKNQFEQYTLIVQNLLMEIEHIARLTLPESRKDRVKHTVILYTIICENFDHLYKYNDCPRMIERFMTVSSNQVTRMTADAIKLNIFSKAIERIFARFMRKYTAYKKAKMNNLVLITRVFPIDIVRMIAQYYI